MLVSNSAVPPQRLAWLFAIVAGAVGFVVNGWGVAVFGGAELVFGGVGVLLTAYCFGPVPAMLAAALAYSRTMLTWGHPWGMLCFIFEAGVVGWLTHGRRWDPLKAAAVYWLLIGGPLAVLTIVGIQQIPFPSNWAIIFKYPTNSFLITMSTLPVFHLRRFREWARLPVDYERGKPLQAVLSQRFGNIIALSILVLSLFVGRLAELRLTELRRAELIDHTHELSVELGNYLASNQRALETLAANLFHTQPDDAQTLDLVVTNLRKNYPGFLTALVADRDGEIIAASPQFNAAGVAMARNNFLVADREYFRHPMTTGKPFVSSVFRGRGFGSDLIVAMSAPVLRPDGSVAMVLEGSLDVGELTRILARVGSLGERAMLIVDATGRVVAGCGQFDVGKLGVLRADPFLLAENRIAGQADFTFDIDNRGRSEEFLAAGYQLPDYGWQLFLAEPMWATQKIIARYYIANAVWAIATIALALMLSRATAQDITRPLKRLVGAVRKLANNEPAELTYPHPPVAQELTEIETELRWATHTLSESNHQLAGAIAQRERAHAELENLLVHLDEKVRHRTAQLDEARRHAESANAAKSEFLASMSHELRTPLNVILGMSELIEDKSLGALNDRQLESVRHIRESGQHLLALITDILDLSKVEAGMLELHLGATDIHEVCEASMRFVRESARRKGLHLETDYSFSTESMLVDNRRVKQILVNLLSNAVKFTPAGGKVGLSVRELTDPVPAIEFTVWDTGIGIADKDRDKLFKPFQQIDSSLSRQYAGTGLGLALVLRMTELHGGTVALESAPGEGSRFRITLPLRAEENQSDSNSGFLTVKRPSSAPFTKSQRILIAEDNDANFQVYVGYLQPLGHQLNRAMNGAEAIELTHSWRPDLVLMDIHMPVMDGLEAMRRLRADPRTVRLPIIAVTALAMAGDRAKCLAAGANAYVTKPVNLNELGRIIVEFSPSPDARLP